MRKDWYPDRVRRLMQQHYRALNERDRRRYAAIEALKLGHGGQAYVAELLGCDLKTVRRGIQELEHPAAAEQRRIRKKGGTQVLSLHATPG